MVEATNYVYLALLICLQYLGLQNESYQITIHFSKVEELEERTPVSVDFEKIEDKENQWVIISLDKKHKTPMTVVKDSVTIFDKGRRVNTTKFNEIDFSRLTKQQDTIFNKKQEVVAIITINNKSIEFKMFDNSVYKQVNMKIIE